MKKMTYAENSWKRKPRIVKTHCKTSIQRRNLLNKTRLRRLWGIQLLFYRMCKSVDGRTQNTSFEFWNTLLSSNLIFFSKGEKATDTVWHCGFFSLIWASLSSYLARTRPAWLDDMFIGCSLWTIWPTYIHHSYRLDALSRPADLQTSWHRWGWRYQIKMFRVC